MNLTKEQKTWIEDNRKNAQSLTEEGFEGPKDSPIWAGSPWVNANVDGDIVHAGETLKDMGFDPTTSCRIFKRDGKSDATAPKRWTLSALRKVDDEDLVDVGNGYGVIWEEQEDKEAFVKKVYRAQEESK